MNPLLLFFKEECIELWSIDTNGRLMPVMYNSSHQLPLYFLLNGDQIIMDNYSKESYLTGNTNSFGDFWGSVDSDSFAYERFSMKNSFASLLPYVLKESVLPVIVKSHFHTNLSNFLKEPNTIVLFDSFVEEAHKEIILKLFFEIIGFDPNSILTIDYFDCFREIEIKNKRLTQNDSFILANISNSNFYFHLIGKNSPLHLAKKVLKGKGQDPILDVILDFLVEIAHAKGSSLESLEIKKALKNDAKIILSKLSEGFVKHTIKNNNLDLNPLVINFHKSDIEGRINNRQSLNFIQNEFDAFRKQNNAEQLPIFLNGEIINQSVFINFFNTTYSKVNIEVGVFMNEFLLNSFSIVQQKERKSMNSISIGNNETRKAEVELNDIPVRPSAPVFNVPASVPPVRTRPVINTPPIIITPPIINTPALPPRRVVANTQNEQEKAAKIKTPEIKKPVVINVPPPPPITASVPKAKVPPPPPVSVSVPKAKVPPPPPPPPSKKK